MAFDLEKKKFTQAKVVNQHPAIHSTIHLPTQTRGKTMQSVKCTIVTYTIKNTFIFRKNDFICSLKKDWYQCRSETTEKIFVRLLRLLEMVNWKAYRKDKFSAK